VAYLKSNDVLQHHYRCPEEITFPIAQASPSHAGYFRVGDAAMGFGRLRSHDGTAPSRTPAGAPDIRHQLGHRELPFDLDEIVDNLRLERYVRRLVSMERSVAGRLVRNTYYLIRPLLAVAVRKHLQRIALKDWRKIIFPHWPVDCSVEVLLESALRTAVAHSTCHRVPFVWFWPDGHQAAVIMTHDVETQTGMEFCPTLLRLNASYGIRSAFQLIPERRYSTPTHLTDAIVGAGSEVNVHDLNHDGHLYANRNEFFRRAKRINEYGRRFRARGFRSGVMYRNQDWYEALEFSYDMSVPNIAHLDPQRGGCCTVFPFFIGKILELPLTTIQDYSLFNILGDYSIQLWKKQIDLIVARSGLVSFNVHPDYLIEARARKVYQDLLAHLASLARTADLWMALPGEVDHWWRARQQMKLVNQGHGWRIEGPGSERARLAYASVDGNRIVYRIEPPDSN
jgi:hypothetical protein